MSDKLEANDYLEIYESRVRLGFLLVGGILLTLGGLLMTGACIGLLLGFLGPAPTTARQFVSPILGLLIGVVGIIMFGSAITQAAGKAVRRAPSGSLSDSGRLQRHPDQLQVDSVVYDPVFERLSR
jgi:hypothetical protein